MHLADMCCYYACERTGKAFDRTTMIISLIWVVHNATITINPWTTGYVCLLNWLIHSTLQGQSKSWGQEKKLEPVNEEARSLETDWNKVVPIPVLFRSQWRVSSSNKNMIRSARFYNLMHVKLAGTPGMLKHGTKLKLEVKEHTPTSTVNTTRDYYITVGGGE